MDVETQAANQKAQLSSHSQWPSRMSCFNILNVYLPKVRNVSAMRVYLGFLDSFLTSHHHWNLKYKWQLRANCREYFLSETFLSPDLAWRMRKWWGAQCSVRAKWGNYAFESVHFMFHYPPPSQQQYPPAFLHLVTCKLTSPSPKSEPSPESHSKFGSLIFKPFEPLISDQGGKHEKLVKTKNDLRDVKDSEKTLGRVQLIGKLPYLNLFAFLTLPQLHSYQASETWVGM